MVGKGPPGWCREVALGLWSWRVWGAVMVAASAAREGVLPTEINLLTPRRAYKADQSHGCGVGNN